MRVVGTFALILYVSVQTCSGQGMLPKSAESLKEARANWNLTMTAHRKNLLLGKTGSCFSDLRQQFPACMQYEPEWCWATAVAELAHFWRPSAFPESNNDCHGYECKVVSYKVNGTDDWCCSASTKPFCAGSCCRVPLFGNVMCSESHSGKCQGFQREVDQNQCRASDCGGVAGSAADIVHGIQHAAGQTYEAKTDGPLSQNELDAVLSKGRPVIMAVTWTSGGGHALTLGGCKDGKYFLHDPLHKAGVYQELSYEQVAMYVPPEQPSKKGQWHETYVLKGDFQSSSAREGVVV